MYDFLHGKRQGYFDAEHQQIDFLIGVESTSDEYKLGYIWGCVVQVMDVADNNQAHANALAAQLSAPCPEIQREVIHKLEECGIYWPDLFRGTVH